MIADQKMRQETRRISIFMQWGFTRKEAERRVKEGKPLTYWEMSEIAKRNHAIAAKVSPSAKATD